MQLARMLKALTVAIIAVVLGTTSAAVGTARANQVVLNADGPGDTYELITSILAPGHNPIETPDCVHAGFGRHIDEIFDDTFNGNVFRFHMHVTPDNDRCIKNDRQRMEIKTYDKSPDNLVGVTGETVEYRWKFKLDSGFQPSARFTHLHQLKAVGGASSSTPLITLTARKGTPNRLELRYAETSTQVTLAQTDLAPFKGVWVQVVETVSYGDPGTYHLSISTMVGGDPLFSYGNESILTDKLNSTFTRPKWGIYRSLNDSESLRDEEVLFADFRIKEIDAAASVPALSEWGRIALGLLMMSAGRKFIHRSWGGTSPPGRALS